MDPSKTWAQYIRDLACNDVTSELGAYTLDLSIIVIAVADTEPVSAGWIELHKSSTRPDLTNGNAMFSLAGGVYDVYDNPGCSGSPVATMTTDANGYAKSIDIKKGTYYVKERTAPKGYRLDPSIKTVSVEPGKGTDLNVTDPPSTTITTGINAGFSIEKRDYNHQASSNAANLKLPQGGKGNDKDLASLCGAEYKVTYYAGLHNTIAAAKASTPFKASTSTRTIKTMPVKENGYVRAVATFNASGSGVNDSLESNRFDSNPGLVLGTYLVEEITPPTGYLNHGAQALIQVRQDSSGGTASAYLVDGTNMDKTCITTTSGAKASPITQSNPVVMTDVVKRGDISIIKFGEPTTNPDATPDKKIPLAGVEFEIVSDNEYPVMNVQTGQWVNKGEVLYTLITNDQGYASTRREIDEHGWHGISNLYDVSNGSLAYGNYLLREVKGPAQDLGYELMDPIPFSIHENAFVWRQTLENKIGTVVEIKKVDAETGKAVRGTAKFRILDSNKKVMTFDDFYPSSAKISVFTTSLDGVAKLPSKFMPGTYYIQEVSAPEGYLWSDKLIPFTCDTNTVKQYGEYATPMTVEFSDYAAKGQIVITKTDERTDQPIISSAATYNVYAAEDITTQDGTVRAKQGDKVDTVSTSDNGVGISKELYLGRYYIQEETAPVGYLLDDAKVEVALEYSGDRTAVVRTSVSVSDKAAEGDISGVKLDEKSLNPIRYAGAVFDVVAAENITGGDGYVWHKKGEIVDTITTGDDGTARPNVHLPLGKYQVVERKAPYGYVLNSTPVDVELKYADQYTPLVSGIAELHDLFSTSDLKIQKLDRETGKTVFTPGCEIGIFANEEIRTADGTVHYHKDDWVGSVQTDETGKIISNFKMPVGKYRLQEINAPEGYVLDEQRQYEVEIPWDGGLLEHNIYDAAVSDVPAKGVITFTKVDVETGKNIPVSGIRAEVYANEDIITGDGTIRAHKDDKVADLSTDENGAASTGELYLGNYRIVETFAPEGYLLNSVPVDVSLVYAGQNVPVVSAAGQIADENAKGIIEITKLDKETGKVIPMPDTTFEIRAKTDIATPDGTVRASAGELVDTVKTDETGKGTTKELYLGIYTITEAKAPHGYVLDATPHDAVLAYKDQHTPVVSAAESIANTVQKGVIKITKTDAESGLPVLVPGAEFVIKAVEDIITPDGTKRVSAGDIVDSIATDEGGLAESKALYLGKYEVSEMKAPQGYLVSDEVKQTELVYGDQSEPLVFVSESISNAPAKGTICIHKHDAVSEEPLPGAVYEIRAADDISTGDGVVHHKAGDVIETVATDENGIAVSSELYLGKYDVVETIQPDGYQLDSEAYPVELVYADQHTKVVHEDIDLANTPTSVIVQKVSASDAHQSIAGTKFVGWNSDDEMEQEDAFVLFADESMEINSVKVEYLGDFANIGEKTVVSSFDLDCKDADGQNIIWSASEKPEQGNYMLHVDYTQGSTNKQESISFAINEHDAGAFFAFGTNMIVDSVKSVVPFQKQVLDSDEMADVVEDDSSSSPNESEGVDEDEAVSDSTAPARDVMIARVPVVLSQGRFTVAVADDSGYATFEYVPQGKIGFAEFEPVAGYVSDRTPGYVLIGEAGIASEVETSGNIRIPDAEVDVDDPKYVKVDMVFADEQTKLYVSKQDVATSKELPGNTLSVYKYVGEDSSNALVDDNYGELIETWVSENEPHLMELLPCGTYILKEEQAVDGYTVAESIIFRLNDTGVEQHVLMNNNREVEVADELIETMGETGDLKPLILSVFTAAVITAAGILFTRRRRMSL